MSLKNSLTNKTGSSSSEVRDYERFCKFLEQASGITLGANKGYLIRSRLSGIMREEDISSLGELVDKIEKSFSRSLKAAIVDAMTTNETLWFRDVHPFEILKEIVFPEIGEQSRGAIRIWSAACSTGQEPYSISMSTSEYLTKNPGKLPAGVDIVATDISPTVLAQAGKGVYETLELNRGLSTERRKEFFQPATGTALQVKDDIRRRVKFSEINLLSNYTMLGRLDVVFCRNVLIYFSHENKCEILKRITGVLKPGGYLFLGGSEPIANYSSDFDMVRCSRAVVYRLK